MIIELLVQLIYILFPLLIYFTLVKNNTSLHKFKSLIVGSVCGLSIFLCMTYPISFVTGNIMDLRTIPWIISFLYGGFPVGIIVTILMFIFRAFLGGAGVYVVLIAYSISAVLLFLFFRNYNQLLYRIRLKYALYLTFVNSLLVVSSIHFIFNFLFSDVILFYLFFIALHLLTMWFTIYIIEIFHENERLQLELLKSEKLNIVGQMAASVAHEIRNPMTTVYGFLQILSKDEQTSKKHKEHLHIMESEIKRAETIISDYLSLAKPEADKLEPIDIRDEVNRINRSLTAFATMYGVHLEYYVEEETSHFIEGSSEKIQQVLVNIIKNSIEASPNESNVSVIISKENKHIKITVKDNGSGMTEEEVKNIGTPFYSLKEKGTGLGLTVCFSIVHSMGGTIGINSKKNSGSTFIISLPEYSPK